MSLSSLCLDQSLLWSAVNSFLFCLRFLLFPFLAVAAYPGLILGWGGDHWSIRCAWIALLSYCWFCVGGSFHETVHLTLFRSERLNRLVGRALGIVTLIPYTAYRETHRRHHAYLNTPADYELWPYSNPQASLPFRRAFVWIDLVGGIVTAPWIYGRIYFLNDPRLPPEVRRTIGREYVALALVWAAGLTALGLLVHESGWNWSNFDPVWLLPLIVAPLFNTARKFVEHLGLNSPDPLQGTRTIVASHPLSRLLSFFNFDIAIHGPHHRSPRSPSKELVGLLDKYRDMHPQAELPVFTSYIAAFQHLWPSLWTNPATFPEERPRSAPGWPDLPAAGDSIEWEPAHSSWGFVTPGQSDRPPRVAPASCGQKR